MPLDPIKGKPLKSVRGPGPPAPAGPGPSSGFLSVKATVRHYPIFLDLQGCRALVIGRGEIAERKAGPLREAGAVVTVRPEFDPADLAGCAIAIGADAPEAQLRALAEAGRTSGIPVNVVDRPELGSCISPALIDRGPITVAISTAGTAPVLARLLRQRIEAILPPALGRLAVLADRYSAELRRRVPDPAARRPLLEAALGGPAADLLQDGRDAEAETAFAAALMGQHAGVAYLVGAGPGDADLLTLRAHRLMGEADLVLHDAGVPSELLALARRDAARAVAGADRIDRVAELALGGRRVVRLALGDGRTLMDEARRLIERGISVTRVAGVAGGPAGGAGATSPPEPR